MHGTFLRTEKNHPLAVIGTQWGSFYYSFSYGVLFFLLQLCRSRILRSNQKSRYMLRVNNRNPTAIFALKKQCTDAEVLRVNVPPDIKIRDQMLFPGHLSFFRYS